LSTDRVHKFRQNETHKRRGEEIREEKKREDKLLMSGIGETPKPDTPPANGKIEYNWEEFAWDNIGDDIFGRWQTSYPAVNVIEQLKRAARWVEANPAKGRKKDYKRFLTNWLAKSQEKGGK
jgi:hypothetical protein